MELLLPAEQDDRGDQEPLHHDSDDEGESQHQGKESILRLAAWSDGLTAGVGENKDDEKEEGYHQGGPPDQPSHSGESNSSLLKKVLPTRPQSLDVELS